MIGICFSLKKRHRLEDSFTVKDAKPDICQPAGLTQVRNC